jgi:rRNA maturation protein Nop10
MKYLIFAVLLALNCKERPVYTIQWTSELSAEELGYRCYDGCRLEYSHTETAQDGREYTIYTCPECGRGEAK